MEDTKAVAFIGASRESPIVNDAAMLESVGYLIFQIRFTSVFWFFGVHQVVPLGTLLANAQNAEVNYDGYAASSVQSSFTGGTYLEYNLLGDPSMYMQGPGGLL